MSKRKKLKYTLLYRFVQSLIAISNAVPRKIWLRFCGLLGRIAYIFSPKTRQQVIRHLTIAFGEEKSEKEIKILSGKVFEMLGKNTGEMLRATRVEKLEEIEKFLITSGVENFELAIAKGKGVIFLSCHVGAFDLQVANMALRGFDSHVIGTRLKDQRLNDLLWKYRKKYGAIPIERGSETFRLLKVLKSGGTVALLIDQDTKVKSRFVNFFGKPAATPVGATILAMKTGAAVVLGYIYLGKDWKQHMHILPEIPIHLSGDEEADMVYNTQRLTDGIENIIRRHPEQWVWMHERWKSQPGEEIR